MSIIKVNINGIDGVRSNIRNVKNKTSEVSWNLIRVKHNLDWQVKARGSVNERISNLQRRVNRQEDKLDGYIRALDSAINQFGDKDRDLSRETKNIIYSMDACKYTAVSAMRAENARSAGSSWLLSATEGVDSMFDKVKTKVVSLWNLI